MNLQATAKMAGDAQSQDLSRPQTSSASIPLSPDTSSKSDQLFTKSTIDSGSRGKNSACSAP